LNAVIGSTSLMRVNSMANKDMLIRRLGWQPFPHAALAPGAARV